MANNCDACNTGTEANAQCSAKGVAVCDAAYSNLPTSPVLKLIGANGECLYTFEEGGADGIVFFKGSNGECTVVSAPNLDLPELIAPGTTFDHVMVMDGTEWKKWTGDPAASGFIFWDHTLGVFKFGQMNESGICTQTAIDQVTEGYFNIFDAALSPAQLADAVTSKCVKRLVPTVPDLFYVDANGLAHQVNPSGSFGFVVFEEPLPCGGDLVPIVKPLCEIATPACSAPPELVQFIGCSTDGKVAAIDASPALSAQACGVAVMSAGAGAKFENVMLGRTWWPGFNGSVRSGTGVAANVSSSILAAQIAAAMGYVVDGVISHVLFYVSATLRTTETTARRTLSLTLQGVVAGRLSAYSWDAAAAVPEDEQELVTTILAPVDGSGNVQFDTVLSSATNADYDYDIQVSGVFACPNFT